MDLYYNKLGREIGAEMPNATEEELAEAVWNRICSDPSYIINPMKRLVP
jgi:hypothetical protein